jgi:hypothetical protein
MAETSQCTAPFQLMVPLISLTADYSAEPAAASEAPADLLADSALDGGRPDADGLGPVVRCPALGCPPVRWEQDRQTADSRDQAPDSEDS